MNLPNRPSGFQIILIVLLLPFFARAQTPGNAQGVDVSDNNYYKTFTFSVTDWQKVISALDLTFAYVKATGGNEVNKAFSTYNGAANGKAAGLLIGVTHYANLSGGGDAATQASFFVSTAGNYIGSGYLPPALDLEGTVPTGVDISQWAQTWLSTVEKLKNIAPVLYVDASHYALAEKTPLVSPITGKAYPVWIADPSNTFKNNYLFKQFTGAKNPFMVPGINNNGFDRDEFYSNAATLRAMIQQNTATPLADLTITAGTQNASPAIISAGSQLSVSCSEDNSGNASAAINDVTVWLSSDAVLTTSKDTYLGRLSFPAVAAGSNTLIGTTNVQIPAGTPSGNYYLFFWADGDQNVTEKDETNNFASKLITVSGNQPTAPILTAVTQCNGTSSNVGLNWNAVNGATSYTLYRNNVVYTSGLSGTQFTNTNITAGQPYAYMIAAQTSSGELKSSLVNVTAASCSTNSPGAFALNVTAGCNGTTGQATLTWTTSNSADSYDVYRNGSLYAPGVVGVRYFDNSVINGQTYTYSLIAKNTSGQTSSNSQSLQTPDCSVYPGISNLTLSGACNNQAPQITLNWTKAINTSSYQIYRNNAYFTTVTSGTTYTDNALTPGLVYTYIIHSVNGNDVTLSTAQSTTATNCSGLPLPSQPNLEVSGSCLGGVSKQKLSWGADANTNSYDVYRNNKFYTSVGAATTYTDYQVTPDSAYFYFIEAKNAVGSSDSQYESSRGLDCTPNYPSAPVISAAASCDGSKGNVLISWTTSNNAVAYDIYRDNNLIYTAFGDMRDYTDNTATAGSHSYYVAASNGSGLTPSNTLSAQMPSCAPSPSVSAVTPSAGETGTQVIIIGANFDNSTAVAFGGMPAQSVKVLSATQLTAVVGGGSNGNVVVNNLSGAVSYSNFQYLFSLPADNFSVRTVSATCKGFANGAIVLAANQVLPYTLSLDSAGTTVKHSFTTTDSISNLPAGSYHLCIAVNGQPSFQQCYDLIVTEPKDLSVYQIVNELQRTVTLQLDGAAQYQVLLNDKSYATSDSTITLPLQIGDNNLQVLTGQACQGTYANIIHILKELSPYPNPFETLLEIYLGKDAITQAEFSVYDLSGGKLLYNKKMSGTSGVVTLDLSDLQVGVYALHVRLDHIEKIYKIIKK